MRYTVHKSIIDIGCRGIAPVASDDGRLVVSEDGHEVRHDWHGFYFCTMEEAEYEDEGNQSVGFDGREHYLTIQECLKASGLWKL